MVRGPWSMANAEYLPVVGHESPGAVGGRSMFNGQWSMVSDLWSMVILLGCGHRLDMDINQSPSSVGIKIMDQYYIYIYRRV